MVTSSHGRPVVVAQPGPQMHGQGVPRPARAAAPTGVAVTRERGEPELLPARDRAARQLPLLVAVLVSTRLHELHNDGRKPTRVPQRG